MITTTGRQLYTADTNELIGDATAEQATASDAANYSGIILIDQDGNVVDASQENDPWLTVVRRVYVSE